MDICTPEQIASQNFCCMFADMTNGFLFNNASTGIGDGLFAGCSDNPQECDCDPGWSMVELAHTMGSAGAGGTIQCCFNNTEITSLTLSPINEYQFTGNLNGENGFTTIDSLLYLDLGNQNFTPWSVAGEGRGYYRLFAQTPNHTLKFCDAFGEDFGGPYIEDLFPCYTNQQLSETQTITCTDPTNDIACGAEWDCTSPDGFCDGPGLACGYIDEDIHRYCDTSLLTTLHGPTGNENYMCGITDDCGECGGVGTIYDQGQCGGVNNGCPAPGTNCSDCFGIAPNGTGVLDGNNNCVDNGPSNNDVWGQSAIGCADSSACNYNMSSLVGLNTDGLVYTCSGDSCGWNLDVLEIWTNLGISPNYIPDNPNLPVGSNCYFDGNSDGYNDLPQDEDGSCSLAFIDGGLACTESQCISNDTSYCIYAGENDISGALFQIGDTCNCFGNPLEGYCGCNGETIDVGGTCGGTCNYFGPDEGDVPWETIPIVYDCSEENPNTEESWSGENCNGTTRFNGAAHPGGLYDNNGNGTYDACDCGGTQRTLQLCYDASSTELSEAPIGIELCPGQTCENIGTINGFTYVTDPSSVAALDTGCMDPTACNYHYGFDRDCDGNDSNINTDCCVYPSTYCVATGDIYDVPNAGENFLCDVDSTGLPLNYAVYCPLCDSANMVDYDGDQCGNNDVNYTVHQGTQVNRANLSADYCANYGDYGDGDVTCTGQLINTGMNSGIDWANVGAPNWILDTCETFAGCGANQDQTTQYTWIPSGCNDPASLGYGGDDGAPLYTGTSVEDMLANEGTPSVPLTTCTYCPPGYSFIWKTNYISFVGIDAQTNEVTADNFSGLDGNFHLTGMSNVLTDEQTGACFHNGDLSILTDLHATTNVAFSHPFYLFGGANQSIVWDADGRIEQLSAGGENCDGVDNASQDPNTCRNALGLEIGLGSTGTLDTPTEIPTSIQYLENLTKLDFSYQFFGGHIPPELGELINVTNMNLSYNYFNSLKVDKETGHQYYNVTGTHYGLCKLTAYNGTPTTNNNWLKLWGNRICPSVDTSQGNLNNITSYPNCLAPSKAFKGYYMTGDGEGYVEEVDWNVWDNLYPEWEAWVYDQLGFTESPSYNEYNTEGWYDGSWTSQNILVTDTDPESPTYEELILDCPFEGCMDPTAKNYWPEAGQACPDNNGDGRPDCCIYDNYLHFPFENGSYGGGMSLLEMIAALHANQCGFQYNSFGDLDVAGNFSSATPQENCDYTSNNFLNTYGYLPADVVNNCNFTFQNTSPDGNNSIDWWDGIWIRSGVDGYSGEGGSGEVGAESDLCHTENQIGETILFDGDARPLEFISKVMEYQLSLNTAYGQYILGYFTQGGSNISMVGIQYFEDFKQDPDSMESDSFTTRDWEIWRDKGRIDIAYYIQGVLAGWYAYPENRPEEYELWEQAPVAVSMSYSQNFTSELDAGFTLYPEAGSPGTLQRSGQWQCSDGGPADICYDHLDACGRVADWIEECTPCGNGAGTCVPMTLDTAAEGYHKITKTKVIPIPYFGGGNSNYILGKNIYTSSLSSSNNPFYYNVTEGNPSSAGSDTVFSVAWGHYAGSGSAGSGSNETNQWKGSSETVYKTYASMLLDDDDVDKGFFITSGSDVGGDGTTKDEWIYVLNLKRNRFEDSLQPGTWTLALSGSTAFHDANTSDTRYLTDNSNLLTSPAVITDAGRRFDIISGSAGSPTTASNYSVNNLGRYGFFYPDAGLMVFGEKLSYDLRGVRYPLTPGNFGSTNAEDNQLLPLTGSTAGDQARAEDAIDSTGAGGNDSQFTINIPTANGGEGGTVTIILDGDQTTAPVGETDHKIAIGVQSVNDANTAILIMKAINGTADNNIDFATGGRGTGGVLGVTAEAGSSDNKINLVMDKPGTIGNISSAVADSSGVDVVDVTDFTGGTDGEGKNALRFINCMRNVSSGSATQTFGSGIQALTLFGEKEVTEVIYACVIPNEAFNFTSNFSIISASGRTMVGTDTGVMDDFSTALTSSAFLSQAQIGDGWETSTAVSGSEPIETTTTTEDENTTFVWPGSAVPTMHGNPTTFITGIQLYDEHGEMLAIAQLSKPLKKDFGKESVIKVKLTF